MYLSCPASSLGAVVMTTLLIVSSLAIVGVRLVQAGSGAKNIEKKYYNGLTDDVVDGEHSLGPPIHNDRYCTYLSTHNNGNGGYRCNDNPLQLLFEHEPNTKIQSGSYELDEISTGEPQIVTTAEATKIRQLLKQMDQYYYEEVLSHPEYQNVRSKCKNRNELCTHWAAVGECESNRIFMLPNCAPACRLCLLQNTNIG